MALGRAVGECASAWGESNPAAMRNLPMSAESQVQQGQSLLQQYQALLEINNAVVSQLDLRELLKVISTCLRRVIPHDAALLTLHDPESARLRLQAVDLRMFGKV